MDCLRYQQQDMNDVTGNQSYFNSRVKFAGVHMRTFDRFLMPNGSYLGINRDERIAPHHEAVLLHFNYTSNSRKEAIMRERHFWWVE